MPEVKYISRKIFDIEGLSFVRDTINGGAQMSENKEDEERKRERLRQEELKRNPTGNMNDSFHRGGSGSLVDLVTGLGWKGTGILILVMIAGVIAASFFFG